MTFRFLRKKDSEIDLSFADEPLDSKIGVFDKKNREVPFYYGDNYEIERVSNRMRLKISSEKNQVDLICKLSDCLNPPYFILYVLIVSRRGNKPGRYQSPLVDNREDLKFFLDRYRSYFETDARHHVWIGAADNSGMLVYDQHNVIFSYGPLEKYMDILNNDAFEQKSFKFPEPHIHSFNPLNDKYEDSIIRYWAWNYSELQNIDEY